MARIISSWSKWKASAMVWRTSIRMPQIFSVTVSSTEACVTSRKTPPMVSYDSYRLTYPRMLYCSMQSEMDAIWDAKSRHWHFPRLRSLLASAKNLCKASHKFFKWMKKRLNIQRLWGARRRMLFASKSTSLSPLAAWFNHSTRDQDRVEHLRSA